MQRWGKVDFQALDLVHLLPCNDTAHALAPLVPPTIFSNPVKQKEYGEYGSLHGCLAGRNGEWV